VGTFFLLLVVELLTVVTVDVEVHIVDCLGLFGTAEPRPEPQAHGFDISEPGQSRHQAVT
jgi:hypothetical protein